MMVVIIRSMMVMVVIVMHMVVVVITAFVVIASFVVVTSFIFVFISSTTGAWTVMRESLVIMLCNFVEIGKVTEVQFTADITSGLTCRSDG